MSGRFEAGLAFAAGLRAGDKVTLGWSSIPSPLNAAALALGGFACVCTDLQHGMHDQTSMVASMQAIHTAHKQPGLRIPVGRFDLASHAVDAGAQVIIAPMINTARDAEALVAATKYPPIGERSWGPALAMDLWGVVPAEYLSKANDLIITLAMIETVEAMDNLDAILAVDGVDGVFVGPSDLSITLSKGEGLQPGADHVLAASAQIGRKSRDVGKIAGVYAFDIDKAHSFFDDGFTVVAVGSDTLALKAFAAGSAVVPD
ncbi:MAG: aldolase/citrate lyase family protein [Pseudomonadota bacterium]